LLILVASLAGAGVAHAEDTPPTLPTPFPLPTPGGPTIDTTELWDIAKLEGFVGSFLTLYAFVDSNWVLSTIILLSLFGTILGWATAFLRRREDNV
jgi:hypothetical protein